MRVFTFLLLSLAFVTIAPAQSEKNNGASNAEEVGEEEIFSHVIRHHLREGTPLDTVASSEVKIYPDIMRYFEGSADYSWCLNKKFLRKGREYLKEHKSLLTSIEDSLAVPPKVIVAVFRVESEFGENTQTHQVLGSLVSVLHYSAPGSDWRDWAQDQLHALPEASQIIGRSPVQLRGSFAGAIGYPQFLPTSIPAYAVDGDGDGKIRLFTTADAAWSAANYLHENGWSQDKQEAVHSYNNHSDYVECIFKYKRAL